MLAAVVLLAAGSAFPLTVMSWNVENLFDDVRDGAEYPAFNPAKGAWTTDLFLARVDALAEVVRRAVPGGPDVLLLQEIENENALDRLADRGLAGMGYAWRVFVPKPGVSANVAVLSRVPVVRVRTEGVGPWKSATPMRDILEVQLVQDGHPLYLLDNHWKAKTGGARQTEVSRRESAAALSRRIREILAEDPGADIVAAGDFNENVDEYDRAGRKYLTALVPDAAALAASEEGAAIALSGDAIGLGARGERLEMYDPWYERPPGTRGSYVYQGEWLTIDHVLLSAGLLDGRSWVYRAGSFAPVALAFMLGPGGAPRSASGPQGRAGFSDHLPLLLTLDLAD